MEGPNSRAVIFLKVFLPIPDTPPPPSLPDSRWSAIPCSITLVIEIIINVTSRPRPPVVSPPRTVSRFFLHFDDFFKSGIIFCSRIFLTVQPGPN